MAEWLQARSTDRKRDTPPLGAADGTIAGRLNLGEITVKKPMSRRFDKPGLRDRAQLIEQSWGRAPGHDQ